MTTEADRLAADGVALRIGDRDVRVRFTMRSMKLLEDRYGSLVAANAEIQQIVVGEHATPYSTLVPLLAMALPGAGVTEDDIYDACGPKDYPRLRQALVNAVIESFPDAEGNDGQGDQGTPAEASPGATSSTSPPSASPELARSSGA